MYCIQTQLSVDNKNWDGYTYYRMATGEKVYDVYPLWLRIGLPWMAARFPTRDVLTNFILLNTSCALIYSFLCYFLLSKYAPTKNFLVPVIGWWLLCASNLAPIPGVFWYPVQTDAACSLLSLLFLLLILSGRINLLWIALIFFVGTTIRENFPVFLIYGLLRLNLNLPRNLDIMEYLRITIRNNLVIIFGWLIGISASIVGLYVIYAYTGRSPFEGKTGMMLHMLSKYRTDPTMFLTFLINTVSPLLLVISAAYWAALKTNLSGSLITKPFFYVVITVLIIVSAVGGTNPERYYYWSAPIFVLAVLPHLENLLGTKKYLLLGIIILWSTFIQRAFVPIPADIGSCDLIDIATGYGVWIGHWSTQCNFLYRLLLVFLACGIMGITWLLAKIPLFTPRFPSQ